VKEEIYINEEENIFIQVDGYENSNSIGGTLNILLHASWATNCF
jgi:hypothetical protein